MVSILKLSKAWPPEISNLLRSKPTGSRRGDLKIASILAAELGADVEVTRTAALLHDLGKAMDHNAEGTHAMLGAEFARRHGVNAKVVNAIASHHHETDQESVEAILVEAADAISGARPAPVVKTLNNISSGSKPWKPSPTAIRALNKATQFRLVAKCGLSLNPKKLTIIRLIISPRRLPTRSNKPCNTPVRFR